MCRMKSVRINFSLYVRRDAVVNVKCAIRGMMGLTLYKWLVKSPVCVCVCWQRILTNKWNNHDIRYTLFSQMRSRRWNSRQKTVREKQGNIHRLIIIVSVEFDWPWTERALKTFIKKNSPLSFSFSQTDFFFMYYRRKQVY